LSGWGWNIDSIRIGGGIDCEETQKEKKMV